MNNETLPRVKHLHELTDEQLENKRKDITICLRDAKTIQSRDAYEYQLSVVESIQRTRYAIAVELSRVKNRMPCDDEQDTGDFIYHT